MTLELNKDHSVLIVGAMKKDKPCVISLDAKSMEFVTSFTIKKKEFGSDFRLRRLPSSDVFFLCGVSDILLLSYSVEKKDFSMYHFFKNVHKGLISDICLSGDSIYSVSPGSDYLHQIRLRNSKSYQNDVSKKADAQTRKEQEKIESLNKIFDTQKESKEFEKAMQSEPNTNRDEKSTPVVNLENKMVPEARPEDNRTLAEKGKGALDNLKSNSTNEAGSKLNNLTQGTSKDENKGGVGKLGNFASGTSEPSAATKHVGKLMGSGPFF